ncbi:hypothetical protein DYB38_000568 [Aphanomyces astaci]|uniref:CST complex subunit CTC1 n=1 Tax=Aphanomyces astaci TaxID=112090 RepID=A0A397CCK6_APHAT|nr:hypothetical protein DYB38_000568 [Aphanomyces astaci]
MLLGRVVTSNATLSRNSWPGLYLSDGDVTLPLVLLRPNITWLHQLVCITSWKCIQTRSMAYLEVDSIHRLVTVPIPILPAYMTWQSLLASCYPTHNRPTYAGPYPVQRALSKRTTSKSWSSKKSKSFVVAGRVAAISPVSTQLDSQYFFVEIEAASDPTTGPASPLVRQFISVLMAGHTATFHSFLWPGLEIVLTDLVKVFAKECNMYMLHTTTSAASSYSSPHTPPHDAHTTLHHASVAPTSHLPPLHIFRALPRYDRQSLSSSLHYTGQVTRRVCDDSFELNHSVVVLFAHFPLPNRCAGLRVGATVTIFQGHRLGPSLIGLCSRSSVVLDEFASAPTPMHLHPRSSRVQELAFHQVPLTTVAYLLELSQDMLARFSRYGATGAASNNRDPNGRHSPAWDVFQDATVRKQTLLRQLASSAGVVWRPRPTLGHSFLCHSATTCFSGAGTNSIYINANLNILWHGHILYLMTWRLDSNEERMGRAISLQALVDRMVARLTSDSLDDDNLVQQVVYPSSDEPQPSILLVGCIEGSIATNDLCLVDRTASIPLALVTPGTVQIASVPSVILYHILAYDVVVTRVPLPESTDDHRRQLGQFTSTAAPSTSTHATHVHIRCHALRPVASSSPPSDAVAVTASSTHRRRLLVLRMDILPHPQEKRRPTHVLVHGVLVPSPSQPSTASDWCMAQVLVPWSAWAWHVHWASVWDICFKVVPHRIEFTPPLTSAYAFEYHLAKFKQDQHQRGHGNEVDWNDLHTRPKVTEALVQYRISADNDTTFVWVATLYEDGSLHHHPHNAIWTSMATHYETMHPPSSLHVIPLQNPSERPLATHVPPQPHPSALEDRLVSTYGIVTDLAIVPAHEYHHIRSKASSTASRDEMILQVTMQDLNAPDVVVVGLWLNSTRCCQAGWPSGLALGVHLVLHRVKVKVRKRGFKLDMVQVHTTAVTIRCDNAITYSRSSCRSTSWNRSLVRSGFDALTESAAEQTTPDTMMIHMYQYLTIDRRIHRFMAAVCHVSYAILKCICKHCHGRLTREIISSSGNQAMPMRHAAYNVCSRAPTPMVNLLLRCIVDDGSAQVELHCEGEVAWNLLQMPQRTVFETLAMEQAGELTYYASNDVAEGTREALWRKAVLDALSYLGQVSLCARRFFAKATNEATAAQGPPMSVLRCGDFSVRTPVQPMVHMEATSVDVILAKHGLAPEVFASAIERHADDDDIRLALAQCRNMHGGGNSGGNGLQRSYSGASLSATPTQSTQAATGSGLGNTHPSTAPASSTTDTVPYPDPTMRRTAMQALYVRYKQLHGTKIDDTTLQRMAARTEHQIATTSTNREEYMIKSQNEMARIDMSQRMNNTPPHSDAAATANNSHPSAANKAGVPPPTASAGLAPTNAMANSFAQQQQHMLQRQLSQNNVPFFHDNGTSMQQAALQQQQQMMANTGGNPFQHAAAPGNLSYQEFCQRMQFQPMDKLVEIMWNQRLMIFQLQQENGAVKKQCATYQQVIMSMSSMHNHGGYNGGLMQPQHAASFFGQPSIPSQPPMKSFGGGATPSTGGYTPQQQQQHMDPTGGGQLSRQSSMTNVATAFGTPQQQQQVSTPQSVYGTAATPQPSAATTSTTTPTTTTATTVGVGGAPSMTPATAAVYWAKVQDLKAKYFEQLKKAYQILCMAAQSGSRQTSKAESMKQNIHYAMVSVQGPPQPLPPTSSDTAGVGGPVTSSSVDRPLPPSPLSNDPAKKENQSHLSNTMDEFDDFQGLDDLDDDKLDDDDGDDTMGDHPSGAAAVALDVAAEGVPPQDSAVPADVGDDAAADATDDMVVSTSPTPTTASTTSSISNTSSTAATSDLNDDSASSKRPHSEI